LSLLEATLSGRLAEFKRGGITDHLFVLKENIGHCLHRQYRLTSG